MVALVPLLCRTSVTPAACLTGPEASCVGGCPFSLGTLRGHKSWGTGVNILSFIYFTIFFPLSFVIGSDIEWAILELAT